MVRELIETTQHPTAITVKETVYQDHLRRIYRKIVDFDGFTKQYLVSDTGERAGVLVTSGSYVLLVRQYRLLINDISFEIPGGKVDEGESPEKTAIRECQEETGVECRNLKCLQNYFPGLDITYNPTLIFYSDDPVKSSIKRTERSVWLPLDTCLEMIFTNKIQDAMTIIALLVYSIRCRKNVIKSDTTMNEVNPVCTYVKKHMNLGNS